MSAAGFRVRPMTGADVDAAMAIAAELPQAPHWPAAVYRAALDPEALPHRLCRVVEDARGQVAGFAAMLLVAPEAELETLAIARVQQRQGLAVLLLDAFCRELKSACITEVLLEVRESNAPARALYRRLGFRESGRRPRYYVDPLEDAVLMNLRLL